MIQQSSGINTHIIILKIFHSVEVHKGILREGQIARALNEESDLEDGAFLNAKFTINEEVSRPEKAAVESHGFVVW
jgi:hypothetical protein